MTEATLKLYAHPLSSYCQKALAALYENAIPFEYRTLDGSEPVAGEFARVWPIGKFPLLTDGTATVFDATTIIEHLDVHHPGATRFVPADRAAAVEARMLDRFFDNYVHDPMQRIVAQAIRPDGAPDAWAIAAAKALLDRSYAWLDARMAAREWAAGDFGLADCAAAPALLYADWTHPIPAAHAHLHAYRRRLLARPGYARALDEARPYRHLFPLGAPTDRD